MPDTVAGSLLEYLSSGFALSLPAPKQDSEIISEVQGILHNPERNGGVTFSLYFGDQAGEPFYAVGMDNNLTQHIMLARFSLTKNEETPTRDFLTENLAAYLARHRQLLINPRCCIGLWEGPLRDGVTELYLDISVLIYHETLAHAFGKESNQIAIFSLRDERVINIGGTGESVEARLQRLEREDRPMRTEGK